MMYLTQGLHRAIQQSPDKTATICDGEQQSFRELHKRVTRLAGTFRRMGIGPGDRVSMLGTNSDRYVEYLLATWWAGAVINPVNTRWSLSEILFSLNDCRSSLLIVDDGFLDWTPRFEAEVPSLKALVYAGRDSQAPSNLRHWESLIDGSDPVEDARSAGDALAAVMYTGGTTGLPKGVMLSQNNFCAAALSRMAEFPCPRDNVNLMVSPLFHVAGLARMITQTIVGGTMVLVRAFDPDIVLSSIEKYGVTETLLVPSMIQMLLDHPGREKYTLKGLQRLVYGASPMPDRVLERAQEAWPQVAFIQAYGMTETAPVISMNPPENHTDEGRRSGRIRSVGQAGFGVEILIVDPDDREVPRGTVGEIIVRGPNVMRGYWERPEETAKALRNGWMHTGDGGYMDAEGYIYIADRVKDMIISGGENVYSSEVEAVVVRYPGVASCAVIGIPHETWGEAVHAVVVPRGDALLDEDEIRQFCRQSLAGYKCPKSVEFRDALPLSGAGKVLKRELRRPYWEAG